MRTGMIVLLLLSLCGLGVAHGQSMASLYGQALGAYKKRQYGKARKVFLRLLSISKRKQQKQKRGSRVWHMWTLGQGDIHYYLSQIARAQKKQEQSCSHLKQLVKEVSSLPRRWRSWSISAKLSRHIGRGLRDARKHCSPSSGSLVLRGQPASAQIELQRDGQWVAIQGKSLRSKRKKISLRIRAEGYESKVLKDVKVVWGKTQTLGYRLTPKSKAAPLKLNWPVILGVAGGVVGVGILVGVVVGVALSPAPQETMTGPNGGAFKIWTTP